MRSCRSDQVKRAAISCSKFNRLKVRRLARSRKRRSRKATIRNRTSAMGLWCSDVRGYQPIRCTQFTPGTISMNHHFLTNQENLPRPWKSRVPAVTGIGALPLHRAQDDPVILRRLRSNLSPDSNLDQMG